MSSPLFKDINTLCGLRYICHFFFYFQITYLNIVLLKIREFISLFLFPLSKFFRRFL